MNKENYKEIFADKDFQDALFDFLKDNLEVVSHASYSDRYSYPDITSTIYLFGRKLHSETL